MKDNTKRIDLKEFREKGYLQELNRQFLHPLGLALEIILEDNGSERLGGIQDYREDDTGIYYDINNSECSNKERIKKFKEKKSYVETEIKNRKEKRIQKLSYWIEDIID